MRASLIVAYLFLGGMGAGAACVLGALGFLVPSDNIRGNRSSFLPGASYRRLFVGGYAAATSVCLLGVVCLLFDMGRPDAVIVLLTRPFLGVVSIGAYALAALVACVFSLALAWRQVFRIPLWAVRALTAVSIGCAAVVMVYTAALLRLYHYVPLYQSPFIFVLFILSSLSTGIAVVVVSAVVCRATNRFHTTIDRLLVVDSWIMVAELISLAAFVLLEFDAASQAVMRLIAGDLAVCFWFGLVGVGLCAPLALNVVSRRLSTLNVHVLVPALLVLTGGFLLRWCIVMAP